MTETPTPRPWGRLGRLDERSSGGARLAEAFSAGFSASPISHGPCRWGRAQPALRSLSFVR
jgi:hypothetical protein